MRGWGACRATPRAGVPAQQPADVGADMLCSVSRSGGAAFGNFVVSIWGPRGRKVHIGRKRCKNRLPSAPIHTRLPKSDGARKFCSRGAAWDVAIICECCAGRAGLRLTWARRTPISRAGLCRERPDLRRFRLFYARMTSPARTRTPEGCPRDALSLLGGRAGLQCQRSRQRCLLFGTIRAVGICARAPRDSARCRGCPRLRWSSAPFMH